MLRVFIRTKKEYGELAQQIRGILNVRDTNLTESIKSQERYGLNVGGGEYFVFEGMGFCVYLIRNEGIDVGIEEKADWPYYVYADDENRQWSRETQAAHEVYIDTFLRQLSQLFEVAEIENEAFDIECLPTVSEW